MRALDSMELTALHLAVIGGSLECLQLLRQFHAPVDATVRVGGFRFGRFATMLTEFE